MNTICSPLTSPHQACILISGRPIDPNESPLSQGQSPSSLTRNLVGSDFGINHSSFLVSSHQNFTPSQLCYHLNLTHISLLQELDQGESLQSHNTALSYFQLSTEASDQHSTSWSACQVISCTYPRPKSGCLASPEGYVTITVHPTIHDCNAGTPTQQPRFCSWIWAVPQSMPSRSSSLYPHRHPLSKCTFRSLVGDLTLLI